MEHLENIFLEYRLPPNLVMNVEYELSSGTQIKGTKTTDCYIVDGYVAGMVKFKGIAHFKKDTTEFVEMKKIKDIFDRDWLVENSLNIISNYEPGELTLRGLHYQLVGLGMINHLRLYKRAVSAMIDARRKGIVEYDTFSDYEREMIGETQSKETDVDFSIEVAKEEIKNWMEFFFKNRWENQTYYIEVFIEKKALIGQFKKTCSRNRIALGACKGYPSLTFLNDTANRFKKAGKEGKELVILYFGDYDPSGEDIPRSIQENLLNDFEVDVKVDRIALMEEQVIEWELPPAPTKQGDSRSGEWNGLGQVELDAVKPEKLKELTQEAIDKYFDKDLFKQLKEQEKEETKKYQSELKEFVNNIGDEDEDE